MEKIGVLAIQGDFEKHIESLMRADVPRENIVEVRNPLQLESVHRLIIPGGESTTVGLLLERFGLGEAIQKRARSGMPIWGTCMGLILLAQRIEGRKQYSLGLLDIAVKRNAFGRQVHSFEDSVDIHKSAAGSKECPDTALGVFIRAPEITEIGGSGKKFASYKGRTVGVIQDKILGTSFHPELTSDTWFHRFFLGL